MKALIQILVLSRDESIVDSVRRAASSVRCRPVSCLVETEPDPPQGNLVLDPRSVCAACLSRLRNWRRRLVPRQVVFLPMGAAPETLLSLPMAFPGTIVSRMGLPQYLRDLTNLTAARSAWIQRREILAITQRSDRARRFLNLAKTHSHANFSVAEAAAALFVSERQLTRIVHQSMGLTPGVVLGLVRVLSVAQEISAGNVALKVVAMEHGYRSTQAMGLHFLRYVGATVQECRSTWRSMTMSERPSEESEIPSSRPHQIAVLDTLA